MALEDDIISSIIQLGFNEELARKAYKNNGNNKEKAINFLKDLKPYGNSSFENEEDSDSSESEEQNETLAFTKNTKNMNKLKSLIYQEDPDNINSFIKLEDTFSIHDWEDATDCQDTFLDILTNKKEIKKNETVDCSKILTPDDTKEIEKIIALGYPDYLAQQAFYASNKNSKAAIKLLKTK